MVMPIFAYRKPVFFMTLLAVEPIMFLLKLSFLFSVFLHIFFHHLKFLAVYARYRHAHATYVHDEMTVAVNTNDVALDAGKQAGGEAQTDVAAGVIFERVKKETDALGRGRHHAHERLHNAVCDDGGPMGAAVVYKMITGKCGVKILLQFRGLTLQEDEAADSGFFYRADAAGLLVAPVKHCLVNEISHIIVFESVGKCGHFGMMDEKVAP